MHGRIPCSQTDKCIGLKTCSVCWPYLMTTYSIFRNRGLAMLSMACDYLFGITNFLKMSVVCFEIIYYRLCRPFKGFLIRLQYFQLKYCLNNLINGMDFICYENSLKHESFISHKIDIKCNHKQEQFCFIQINTLTIYLTFWVLL